MATLNLKTPIKVRFKDDAEAENFGCKVREAFFPAGSHVVPDAFMEHPYVKANHVEARPSKAGVTSLQPFKGKSQEEKEAEAARAAADQAAAAEKAEKDKQDAAALEAARVAEEEAAAKAAAEAAARKKAEEEAGGNGGSGQAKPVDEMSYTELQEEYTRVTGKPAHGIKKADLLDAIRLAGK